MDHLSTDQLNHINFIARCIMKPFVENCMARASEGRHFADLDEVFAVVTPMLLSDGCTFPETLVRELIREINDEAPARVDDE